MEDIKELSCAEFSDFLLRKGFHEDIILTSNKNRICRQDLCVVTMYPLESNSETSENNEAIETALASVPMEEVVFLPEKVGQLLEEFHFLALAKIIQNLVDHNKMIKMARVKGVLVDRSNGIINC